MRYTPSKDDSRVPVKGDVWMLTEKPIGEREVKFPAVVASCEGNDLRFRRCIRHDTTGRMHLISDVHPTGLEYAAFMDCSIERTTTNRAVHRMGRLSRCDRSYI